MIWRAAMALQCGAAHAAGSNECAVSSEQQTSVVSSAER